jgi:NADP-dependent 3-hydroxy acid dehydrogenase YdfG
MLQVGPGQIVFINSSVGLKAVGGVSQFAATQHSLKAIADSLRDEVNPDGIRVLNVFPGRTATPRQESIFQREGRTYHPELLLQPEDIAAVVVNSLTLPRTAEVTEISIRPLKKSY